MGTWNYRIMRDKCTAGYHFAVHEVYYDEKTRKVNGWTTDGMGPSGETMEELRADMEFIKSALRKPILSYQTGKPIKLSKGNKQRE